MGMMIGGKGALSFGRATRLGNSLVQPPSASVSYVAIMAWHQSNMAGAHRVATGGSLLSPDDDPAYGIMQISPNGGTSVGDPAKAQVLLPASGHLLFPGGTPGDIEVAVTPAFSYAKKLYEAGVFGSSIPVLFDWGVGGTSMLEWMDYALVGSNPQGPSSTMPKFEAAKATWNWWLSQYPNTTVHSMIYSPVENEMLEPGPRTPTEVAQRFDNLFASHRNLALCSNAWIGLLTPTPEFTVTAQYKLLYNEIGRAAFRHPKVFTFHTPPGGAVGGDQVHATNNAQRNVRGPGLKLARDAAPALQSAAPPVVTGFGLVGQTLTFPAVGAPHYFIDISPPGANTWTTYEPTFLMRNLAGDSLTCTLPGSGNRDYRIRAKSYGGESTSAVGNYTAPVVSVPTPLVQLDFENATVDGSGNIISIPSIGTDTTPWIPHSSSGTGAAALMKFALVNGKRVLDITSPSMRLHYAGTLAAGNISGVIPLYYGSLPSNGVMIGWGQASTNGDMFLTHANSGANVRMGFGTTGVQVIGTNNPFTGKTGKYMSTSFVYDRTANTLALAVNDVPSISGTPTQRAASPSNSGGTQLYGYNTDASNNGFSSAKALPPKIWNQVLTSDQIAVVNAEYASTFGISFG